MNNHGLRLEYDLLAMLSYFKGKVRIFIIRRCKGLVETADFFPEFRTNHNSGTGNIIDFLYIIVLRILRVLQTAIIPSGTVGPNNSAGFLQTAIRINEFGTNHTNAVIAVHKFHQRLQPAIRYLGIIVQEEYKLSAGNGCCLITVFQKSHILLVPGNHKIIGIHA